jgi:uncharacterized protein (DUF924 family)
MNDRECIAAILEFWFGEINANGVCAHAQQQLWFKSSEDTDGTIRDRFGKLVAAALNGELDHWSELDQGCIALIILLDQFTRNIYRDTPQAFAGDERALALVQSVVANNEHVTAAVIHQVFLYIPYEHSENLTVQEQGILLFDQLLQDCPEAVREQVAGFRQYSVAHRDVIEKFGRFPHRNKILGRESTAVELEHLKDHGGF